MRENGFEAKIVDNYLERRSIDDVVKTISKQSPSLVGLSCTSITYQTCIKLAKSIKEKLGVPIVVGGPHPSVLPDSMLQHPLIDFVVIGEGELTLLDLLTCLKSGASPKEVKGLMFRKDGEVINTGPRPYIQNLDALPHPARDLLPIAKYPNRTEFCSRNPTLSVNSSRGCTFNCKFCSVRSIWGRRFRFFSPSWVVEDIEQLVHMYGAKGVYFREDNFTINSERVEGICDSILKNELDIRWVCESRVDLISESLLKKMAKAGCETIWFGIESGSQRILNLLSKGITIQQAEVARQLCENAGIKFGASFMIGIPGEKREEMRKTLELAKRLKPDHCWFNVFVGLPNSPLYRKIVNRGLFSHIDDNYLAYVKTEEFDYKLMKKIKKEFIREYKRAMIFKPSYIIRRLLKIRNFDEILHLVKNLPYYIR